MTVRLSQPRRTARIAFTDGRVFSAPVGTSLEEYVLAATAGKDEVPAYAAIVNGRLMELERAITHDSAASLVRLDSADGMCIYRRSLTFLLIAVAAQHFPDARVTVEHSVTNGGYYCRVKGRADFTEAELAELETQMRAVVNADLPIERVEMPLDQAIELFEQIGDTEKATLLRQRRKPSLIVYRLLETRDYFHGFMVPSTRYVPYFAIEPADGGFLLRFPHQSTPTEISSPRAFSPIFQVFNEYGEWLRALGIRNVSGLNAAIERGRTNELILVAEALHEQRISTIAAEIAAERHRIRIILIAGPSASGKTTTARRLAVRLLALGLRPLAISIDDYFVNRELTPRDEEGEYDFESLQCVDVHLLGRQLNQLIAGEEVQMPRFDFHEGKRLPGPNVRISPDHILILEGIHGLNPELLADVDERYCYRIYVSALTQLNLDRYNRISTTDTRLLRRIVRDARTRGYSAADTIARWQSVRRGERHWIFPYQDRADVMFNSALPYELGVLKPLAAPLLMQIEPGTPERIEAGRLLALLQWFKPIPDDHIPSDSVLREFVGQSILEDYRPWQSEG
ncbi:MAG: hypothetical protein J5I90_16630 [Caldilineales bacterium]|nr:hypothetical protein [Caldilineales bacterium]